MLTALELENFKGIAARQRVEFAPLTLLFGANSAGKSTVLHALLYLHELLERGIADVDRTELGGSVIDLGGFARLVHRHEANRWGNEASRAIVLRAEFATPGGLNVFDRDLTDFPFPNLGDEVESAWLELTIRFRTTTTFRGPLVERAVIGVGRDRDPLVWLETGATLSDGEPLNVRVNLGHRLIVAAARDITDAWKQIAVPEEVLNRALEAEIATRRSRESADGIPEGWRARALEQEGTGYGDSSGVGAGLGDGSEFGDKRSLPVFAVPRSRLSALPPAGGPLRVIPFGDADDLVTDKRARAVSEVRTFLEMAVLGTTAQLAASLRDALYIGPLRTIPPRGFLYDHFRLNRTGITSWADGLAAWDLLLADRSSLVERTNYWLKQMGAGCQVVVHLLLDDTAVQEGFEDVVGHVEESVRCLLLDTGTTWVLPSEVGAGISQVIPVVVAALAGRAGLSLIEQPELHVHPALQVCLGDLFIDAATRDGGRRTMLIETHSEHLILRILRRIRETTENELPEGVLGFSSDNLSVLYVESDPDGVRIRRLHVDERGEFKDRWPKGFFAERMEELL
jgi:hypothetical protein